MNKNRFELCEYYWKNLWNWWIFSNFKNLTCHPIFESFTLTSIWPTVTSFRATITINHSKIISLFRKINWRAPYGRARACARAEIVPPPNVSIKNTKISLFKLIVIDTVCARNHVHTHMMHLLRSSWPRRWCLNIRSLV